MDIRTYSLDFILCNNKTTLPVAYYKQETCRESGFHTNWSWVWSVMRFCWIRFSVLVCHQTVKDTFLPEFNPRKLNLQTCFHINQINELLNTYLGLNLKLMLFQLVLIQRQEKWFVLFIPPQIFGFYLVQLCLKVYLLRIYGMLKQIYNRYLIHKFLSIH